MRVDHEGRPLGSQWIDGRLVYVHAWVRASSMDLEAMRRWRELDRELYDEMRRTFGEPE